MDIPYRHLWLGRSFYGKVWLGAGIAGWVVIFRKVMWQTPFILPSAFGWRDDDAWVALALTGLIVSAPFMHALDVVKTNGHGFLYQHEAANAFLQFDDGAVSGILSVQSIRTAVTTFILTAVVGQIPKVNGLPDWSGVSSFQYALGTFVCFVLLVSLVTTLVATLCLDYSIRFGWSADTPKMKNGTTVIPNQIAAAVQLSAQSTKLRLRMKAKDLNEIGFYCLMWSLAALPALVGPYHGLAAVLLIYIVMWAYYFFPKSDVPAVRKAPSVMSDKLSKAMEDLLAGAIRQVAAEDASAAATRAETAAKNSEAAARVATEAAKRAGKAGPSVPQNPASENDGTPNE